MISNGKIHITEPLFVLNGQHGQHGQSFNEIFKEIYHIHHKFSLNSIQNIFELCGLYDSGWHDMYVTTYHSRFPTFTSHTHSHKVTAPTGEKAQLTVAV